MVIKVGETGDFNKCEFQGLSTDEKPTTANNNKLGEGSTFFEVDTKNGFSFSANINPATGNGWWAI